MRSLVCLMCLLLSAVSCATPAAIDFSPNVTSSPEPATAVASPVAVSMPTPDPVTPAAPPMRGAAKASPASPAASPTVPAESTAPVPAVLDWMASSPPYRDDVQLAVAYLGANPAAATLSPPAGLEVGATETFYVGNVDSNTVGQIEAVLMSIGENAYYWFEQGVEPDSAYLTEVTAAFDEIYEGLYAYFGSWEPAGGRVHIIHAAPETLCDDADTCGLAGYFSSRDLLPRAISPWSNERAMFVMNVRQFGGETYLDTLSHELRHLLGHEYDRGEEDWFVEGAAMLAEDLAGFPSIPQARGILFLENPDQQLNSWTDGYTIPHYGQGYLLNRFLYDQLGADLYREYTMNPRAGLDAVDEIARSNELDISGETLWLNWLVAMALNGAPDAAEAYRWDGPSLGPVSTTSAINLPASFETTVNQFAADYYELPSSGTVALDFAGRSSVSLLGVPAPSGSSYWYAQRANSSNPRLTRVFDLRGIDTATLHYKVFADIEQGYDFAYVSISTDGGRTWRGLQADGMQGLDMTDDPSDSALTDRFYTGRIGEWQAESIDLTPFTGQEVLLRFEYVTDLVLTFGGFAVDDIAVPEIGFYDDAESTGAGWTAEGFARATAEIPQSWRLQLITFDAAGRSTVEALAVAPDGRLAHTYEAWPGGRRPILIVAALSPETLQPASYVLDVRAP